MAKFFILLFSVKIHAITLNQLMYYDLRSRSCADYLTDKSNQGVSLTDSQQEAQDFIEFLVNGITHAVEQFGPTRHEIARGGIYDYAKKYNGPLSDDTIIFILSRLEKTYFEFYYPNKLPIAQVKGAIIDCLKFRHAGGDAVVPLTEDEVLYLNLILNSVEKPLF